MIDVSIITPCLPQLEAISSLVMCYESILCQQVNWEWIIQLDGSQRLELPQKLLNNSRISINNNRKQLGVSVTRNYALNKARGKYIFALDDDDELVEDGLPKLLNISESYNASYSIGKTVDVFPDGEELFRMKEYHHIPGPLPVGYLEEQWIRGNHLKVHPPATLYRTEALLAIGGWTAIEGMEDLDVLLTISSYFPGAYTDECVFKYHLSPDQTIKQSWWDLERQDFLDWCDKRVIARRLLRGEHVEIPPHVKGDPDVLSVEFQQKISNV